VAVFGFPRPDEDQAEKATKHALALLDSFEQLRGGKDSAADSVSVHLGISSGTMIVAPLEGEDDRRIFSPRVSRWSSPGVSVSPIASMARAC
jgi:hypothetical protein